MSMDVVIAGAGMGGLSASIALGLKGQQTTLLEKRTSFGEVGAGLQLGPNATRILQRFGLSKALERYAAWPSHIEVFRFDQEKALAKLSLGEAFQARYGAPYATLHRADFQAILHERMLSIGQTDLRMGTALLDCKSSDQEVQLHIEAKTQEVEASNKETFAPSSSSKPQSLSAKVLIGADGVSSDVRRLHWPHRHIYATRHLAYRATLAQKLLPLRLRQSCVRVYMGPQMHWVQYPIRCGEWLNMVVLMEVPFDATHSKDTVQTPLQQTWHEQVPLELSHWHFSQALKGASPDLQDLFRAAGEWSPWRLFDTNPLIGAHQLAQGRLALLGDAGHAMLPFLAQGAGMSIEDADALANAWAHEEQAVTLRLENYAQSRWRRNARVQKRAQTNASVFHAKGAFAGVRDLGLSLLGERLLDMPWLYGHR